MRILFLLLILVPFQIDTLQAFGSAEIIDGYSNKISAFPGDSLELYLNATTISDYHLKLVDLSGKEVFSTAISVFPQLPSNPIPYEKGYGYLRTTRVRIPQLPSGIYLWDNKIPLVVRSKNAKVIVVYSSNTVNAYCNAGGKSLYGFNSTDRLGAHTVSFLRPMLLPEHSEAFLRWIQKEQMGDVGYITDLDLEDYNAVKKSELIIIPGHNEYWTLQARKNFDRFVHQGRNALILSGNTMWWQVRYSKNKDQMICYRQASADPIKNVQLKTITWSDSTLNYPILNSTGTDFRYGGYGLKTDKGWNGYKLIANSPLLAGTDLKPGDIIPCPSDEVDGIPVRESENGIPYVDFEVIRFHKVELIAFDRVSRGGKDGIAAWIAFQPTKSSGIVINTASTDWCSSRGIGSQKVIEIITRNMIQKLLSKQSVFSTDEQTAPLN